MTNKYLKGQIGLVQMMTIGGAIIVAIIGGYFGQSNRVDGKIDIVRTENTASILGLSERVSANEANTVVLIKNTDTLMTDVKLILSKMK